MVKLFPMTVEEGGQWLLNRRWYGDKSRHIDGLVIREMALINLGELQISLCLFEISFRDGGSALYFSPILADNQGGFEDAFNDQRFVTWWVTGFAEGRSQELEGDWSMLWNATTAGDSQSGWGSLPGKVLTGEQSNTSISFGSESILKTFRKWQPGMNPDSEIVEFLTEQTTFRQVPRFLGSIRLCMSEGTTFDVATVQSFVSNQGDCWKWLPPALQTASSAEMPKLIDAVHLLGLRTGELHAALATGTDHDFVPEAISEIDARALRERVIAELRTTCDRLADGGALSSDVAAILQRHLEERLGEADGLVGSQRIRVHGDYHLGQVLRVNGDFVIIDFEGEPSRTMSERREKHSALKDVAGMLRSIDYAVAAASIECSENQKSRIVGFGSPAYTEFLTGYRTGVATADEILPQRPEAFDAALDVFMIEKALYETRYELDNRPDWVSIPLGALQRIAGDA